METETIPLGFSEAFENLKRKDQNTVRKEIMSTLGWAISTFYIKKSGDTPIRSNEIPTIEAVFLRYGIDAWTGRPSIN